MNQFFIRVYKSSFLKIAGKVGILTFVGNIIGILLLPVISKYFTQDEFGLFALFFNLLNIFVPFITLGLNDAFISVTDEDELNLLLGTSLICVAIISPVLCFIIFGFVYFDLFGYGLLPLWSLVFFLIEMILVALVLIFQSWSVRKAAYVHVGISNFFLGFLKPTNQILCGITSLGFFGLILAEVIARLGSLIVFLRKFRFSIISSIKKAKPSFYGTIGKYKIFLSRLPSTFIFNLGTALPTLLITNEFGITQAGNFTFMMALLIIPSAFVQKVLGDVFIGFFFQKYQDSPKTASRFFKYFFITLFFVAILLAGGVYFFATYLFNFFFGNQWQIAASMLILYIPYFIGDFTVAPFGNILNITNRPHYKLIFDVLRLVGFFLSAFLISFFGGSINTLILLFSISGLISYLVYFFLIVNSLNSVKANKLPFFTSN